MIVETSFFTDQEIQVIQKEILSNNFPWYIQNESTTGDNTPFFSHVLANRVRDNHDNVDINSDYFYFFENIVKRFCIKNDIKYNKAYRASLNLTYHSDKEFHGNPHIDHEFEHNSVIMYLNKTSGNTVLFDRQGKNKLIITSEVEPEAGKILLFDGLTYHSIRPCGINETRVICVFTFG
jgi:hypothetical protein